jgi:hypothetical protein
MSQVTDGAKIQHTEAFMKILARKRKTNWKNLDGDFKTVLKNYDIGQKDWHYRILYASCVTHT